MSHWRRSFAAIPIAALALAMAMSATALAPGGARAQTPAEPTGPVQLTGMRTWVSPAGTRLVLEFSAEVVPVAPDYGAGPQLVVAVPVPGITAAAGVPASLAVNDSAVTSVQAIYDASGSPTRRQHYRDEAAGTTSTGARANRAGGTAAERCRGLAIAR